MSDGRVELGLGAGLVRGRTRGPTAFPFPPWRNAFEKLEEQFAIITGLWGTKVGETFSYSGKHYSLNR